MLIYEEFMARSSTRLALKKGGNFMGMMNVLMQLRKVCNHPDLFEPRAIVTPFVVDPIILNIASCVPDAIANDSPFHAIDGCILSPLWSGSRGQPSTESALRHDPIESQELLELEHSLSDPTNFGIEGLIEDYATAPDALKVLVRQVYEKRHNDKAQNMAFLNSVNSSRCRRRPFAYHRRLLNACHVPGYPFCTNGTDYLSTPELLLAMRKSQNERSQDLSLLIKRFVFCVPKAGPTALGMCCKLSASSKAKEKEFQEMLLEPTTELLRPFREASARLSSDFPDKKLIQFDSGKLQTLAVLLRERKRGGHKVLIFTQMGKMVRRICALEIYEFL